MNPAFMRIALQPAFVLHRRDYRNTSLLLEVLSRDYGRLGLVARGAHRPPSPWQGLLQPFVPLLLSCSGGGELLSLSSAEATGLPIRIPPGRLLSGFYVNELLLRLVARHDPQPGLFEPYQRVLESLAEPTGVDQEERIVEERALRIFEKRLLAELGYGLQLSTESLSGAPVVPTGQYHYILEQGPVVAGQGQAGIAISGKSLLAWHHEELSDPVALREIKRLIRAALGMYLGERPLKTRELLLREHRRRRFPPLKKGG